jgi:hypothetical protein
MMTTLQGLPLIGAYGWYRINGLAFEVVITNARKVFNRTDYLVRPVHGKGIVWVSADTVDVQQDRPPFQLG